MRKTYVKIALSCRRIVIALAGLFLAALVFRVGDAFAVPARTPALTHGSHGDRSHDKKHPLGARWRELRQEGLREKLRGHGHGRTHRLNKGRYVELEQTRGD